MRENGHPSFVGNRFEDVLGDVLRHIPGGKVATCGAVARALGDVRAARAVARWITDHPDMAGATKVVRADGRRVLAKRGDRSGTRDVEVLDALPPVGFLESLRQEQLRAAMQVSEVDAFEQVRTVGAADAAYEGDTAFAVAVRCDAETLEVEDIADAELPVDFPYIPTYLAFREFAPVEAAVRKLRRSPDVLFIDGHGRLHPSLGGFACYAGVRLGLPTVGIAKHPLVGRPDRSMRLVRGAIPLTLDGVVRGYAWTPPGSSRPIYVSVGHRVALESALRLVQRTTRRHVPEPLRIADRISKERKREKWEKGGRQ